MDWPIGLINWLAGGLPRRLANITPAPWGCLPGPNLGEDPRRWSHTGGVKKGSKRMKTVKPGNTHSSEGYRKGHPMSRCQKLSKNGCRENVGKRK